MAVDPVASRYAQALFETAQAEHSVEQTLEQLLQLGALVQGQADLRRLLLNPDITPDEKAGMLQRLMGGSWSGLVQACVQLVIGAGRAPEFPAIVEAFRALADAAGGRVRVIVRSARPVSEQLLNRLGRWLEARERRTAAVEAEVRPELLGGLQVQVGHRIIDGSVRRQLDDLRQQLTSLRVH